MFRDTIDDSDVAEVEKPGSNHIPASFANPKLSQSDIELDLRLQTVPTPASPCMFGKSVVISFYKVNFNFDDYKASIDHDYSKTNKYQL